MDKILNKDCLSWLFSFLLIHDIRNVKIVCKQFHRIIRQHSVYKQVVFNSAITQVIDHVFTPFLDSCYRVTHFCRQCRYSTNSGFGTPYCIYTCGECKRLLCGNILGRRGVETYHSVCYICFLENKNKYALRKDSTMAEYSGHISIGGDH